MKHFSREDVLEYVAENDIKFIRMQFCDLNGALRNVSIMSAGLEKAFEEGVPFYPSRIAAMVDVGGEEMRLHPDPATLSILPWRPQHGRVARLLCGITHPDGKIYAGDYRSIARDASKRMRANGLALRVGIKCAFSLFTLDDAGNPTFIPHDNADAYAIAPLDRGENVRRDICLIMEEMGIQLESSCHAQGPGQHEFVLAPKDAFGAADDFITLDSVVRGAAARSGLHAALMPQPLPASVGNYLHLTLSLTDLDGVDPFAPEKTSGRSGAFFTGIRGHLGEIYAFLSSTTNSYERIGGGAALAPMHGKGDGVELTCADSAFNPYLAMAVLQAAGLQGLADEGTLSLSGDAPLPDSLDKALALTADSALCRDALGETCLQACLAHWGKDCAAWNAAPHPKLNWERQRYFTAL